MSRFAPWELEPEPCQRCGARRWVLWWAAAQQPGRSEVMQVACTTARGLWCRVCTPTLPCALAVAVNFDGQLYVWQHPQTSLDSQAVATLGWWLTVLSQLSRDRVIERTSPGAWRLEIGDDGRLWMPWNPASDSKAGVAWPLRPAVLRRSRRERLCICCARRLRANERVHRADLRYLDECRTAQGWSRMALTDAIACGACTQAVLRAVPPGLPGRRVVKHLVAIDGGLA